jgi:hypothetical protein
MYLIYHVRLVGLLKRYSIPQEVAVSVIQIDHEVMSNDADTESFNLT